MDGANYVRIAGWLASAPTPDELVELLEARATEIPATKLESELLDEMVSVTLHEIHLFALAAKGTITLCADDTGEGMVPRMTQAGKEEAQRMFGHAEPEPVTVV